MSTLPFVRTINDQNLEYAQTHLTNSSLSYKDILLIKPEAALKINQHSVYKDYTYHLSNITTFVIFKNEAAKRYAYKPKKLAYDLYDGNTELYSIIMRINHLYSISEFSEEKLIQGIYIPTSDVIAFMDEVLIKEKNPINRNLSEVLLDVNSLP